MANAKILIVPFIFLLSIKSIRSQVLNDSLRSMSFEQLEDEFYSSEIKSKEKAILIAKVFLEKARKLKDSSKIINGFYLNYRLNPTISYPDSIIAYTMQNQTKEYPALAYFYKAKVYLYVDRNIEETINNLNEARTYATRNENIDLLYRINYLMGVIKSEHLNEDKEALAIYKDCEAFYQDKPQKTFKSRYLSTLHAISETYIDLEKYDSTSYYNKLGYTVASKSEDPYIHKSKAYFTLCEGLNMHKNAKYQASIDSIRVALPTILEFNDVSNSIDCYFYLGKSYHHLGKSEKAMNYFKKTDSILETLSSIPQYKHLKTYEYLKNYYKEQDDLENQNKYLNKLNNVLANYLDDQMVISKKIKQDYDIPLLEEEQQSLVKKLNKNTNQYITGILILVILLICISILYYLQYKKKKVYKQRFDELMDKISTDQNSTQNESKTPPTTNEIKELQVPKKHVDYILEKLGEFEKEKGFTKIGVTAQSLADEIDTNVKYLSRVINHYKNQSFSNYLNELRINYAVKELQENVTLRKYTIKAIASEFGYSRAETFSNAFYKQVQIKPSYYIKQLSKSAA